MQRADVREHFLHAGYSVPFNSKTQNLPGNSNNFLAKTDRKLLLNHNPIPQFLDLPSKET